VVDGPWDTATCMATIGGMLIDVNLYVSIGLWNESSSESVHMFYLFFLENSTDPFPLIKSKMWFSAEQIWLMPFTIRRFCRVASPPPHHGGLQG